ncbi:hypothetical protein RF679_15945 [Undibacterium cyanobacteriorum]|uniref:Restriction endonuclease n=1 Tax=Undibacterium cyanobacteriorum TaxID=3073561 RepID=A0ABY9RHI4_9BURK|nr:hypothetical protein [Undibacterium sp. 20NA77.5]WMW80124.1 hypothetical protein RF679_15945 [Undibacterium sp. 20NA77.5]
MYIFRTEKHVNPRFKEHDLLCDRLVEICHDWEKELDHYISKTENLFGRPELPWQMNERVIVSSLVSSIAKNNNECILAEELPITKSTKSDLGRCDLWAHIPFEDDHPFNFYLEAKKFIKEKRPNDLRKILLEPRGIHRMFHDYVKSIGKLSQISTQQEGRKHQHYVIGMICIPICGRPPKKDIQDCLDDVFTKRITLKNIEDDKTFPQKRLMARFPTVGFYYEPTMHEQQSSMLVTFTVLGSSRSRSNVLSD